MHLLGACVGGAPGEALGVCVVRGWRGKLKSRQLPTDLDVYLSGASAVSAATVGFCSLQASVPKRRQMTGLCNSRMHPWHHSGSSSTFQVMIERLLRHSISSGHPLSVFVFHGCSITAIAVPVWDWHAFFTGQTSLDALNK